MANTLALPAAALAFCTWAVYLGGLASLQSDCDVDAMQGTAHLAGVYGFSSGLLSCMRVYRYYWFIMCIEFVVIAAVAVAAVTGHLNKMKLSFLGLAAIVTLLYIEASNAFLTAESVEYYQDGQPQHRMRTTVAGAIMTAVANSFLVIVLGMNEECEAAAPAVAEKAVPAAENKV